MDLSEPISGRWWIPNNENAVVYGTVEQSDDGIHLEAVDPFELAPEPAWGSDVILPIIHGETVGGDAVTLISCRRTKWSAMTRGPERWRINATVTGRHLSTAEEPVTDVTFQFGSLLEWADDPATLNSRTKADRDGISVTSTKETLGEAVIGDVRLELVVSPEYDVNDSIATIRRSALIRMHVGADDLAIRDAVEAYGFAVRDLLAWTTRSYLSVDRVGFLLRSDSPERRREQAVYYAQLTRPHKIPPPVQSYDMTFSRTGFDIPFDTLIPVWFALWRRHRKTFTLITVPTYAPYLYADTKLLTAWLAVEGYHAVAMKLTDEAALEEKQAHRERVDLIVAAVPPEYRDWTEQQLRGKSTIGQKRKLQQIVERAGATGSAVIDANPNFLRNALASRQKVAHPSPFADDVGPQLHYVASILRWLLTHCLLIDLGVAESKVASRITGDRHFQHDVDSCARYHTKP